MKKLLTMLGISSSIFLITTGIILSSKDNHSSMETISFNVNYLKRHKITGNKLEDIGYYKEGNLVRIEHIPYNVEIIACDLPREITSLKNAFVTRTNDIQWTVKWDTSNIVDMSGTFYNTREITDKSIQDWNTSNVTNMSEMFAYSKGFNLDLSSWDVSKVKTMEKMFLNAEKFNNGEKPLKWDDKLKEVTNMNKMFYNAYSFNQNLNSWILKKSVKKDNFGLEESKQPMWKVEETTSSVTSPSTIQPDNSSSISPRSDEIIEHNSGSNSESEPNDMSPKVNENNNQIENITNELNDQPSNDEDNNHSITPITENETTETEKTTNDSSSDLKNDIYTIPSKPNTINSSKQKSSKTLAITMSVLGSATILGVGFGVSYYYRKNLKDFYFKTKNKIFKSK
ncbi:BspA family leucine-rich repeat surface protein [Mycoplasma mycoides]|uniref:BspA family leucine-rich repeat surface protein n=2 Tax=Mycoplasma mycoides TaxID=2102 RepID=UPI00223F55D3|nr:BspA family leucine-rich repeat surface protein [Mycoplasma mycoides]QVJ96360.1 BspA family leucine-rich repeat surface protein [Mycoplasma mycoides subsp. capri]QVJ97258.1 BspA family leucine-rich repeat surface protein [Mycoplasma mycoides subsp. capri]QVK01126.1 BspA family leucine-rich repeat surface protein [Mycoplasma mycoides subsp. capri]